MAQENFDPYRVLGVPVGASKQQIRRQYRRLARRLHPDLRRDDPRAHEEMVRLNRAYQILMDDRLRAQWEARAAEQWLGPLSAKPSAEQSLIRAREFLAAGRLEEAKMACADALDADPRCAEAFALLGRIYMREGLHKLAREMFAQARRLGGVAAERAAQAAGAASTAGTVAPPRAVWVPEPVRVRWWLAAVGLAAAAAVLWLMLGRGAHELWRIMLALGGTCLVLGAALGASGVIEPADAVLDEPVWASGGRGAPLWLVMLVAGAAWGHLALIFYVIVGYLGECLHRSAGIFFLSVYGAAVAATAIAPASAKMVWLLGINAAVTGGIIGWMIGSIFSPHEWWRAHA